MLQDENQRLKEALSIMIKRIKEMTTKTVLEPISKSNPAIYTELKQCLDSSHRDLERRGFVTFLQEKEFFSQLKISLPPSTQQIEQLIECGYDAVEKLGTVMAQVLSVPAILKCTHILNTSNSTQRVILTTKDLMARLGIHNWKPELFS